MKRGIFSIAFAVVATVAITSPILAKAATTFGQGGVTAVADLQPSSNFNSAYAYTQNNNFTTARVGVSLLAMNSAGQVYATDGPDYDANKAEASISGYGTATKYKSIHGLYDTGYNYITSISIEKP